MANQERGELGVEVGGRRYTLRPTFDALCELEDLRDQPIEQILASIDAGRFSGVRAVVWTLLQDQHAAEFRTLKDASVWIEEAGGLDVVMGWLQQMFAMNSAPPDVGGVAHPPEGQADGTGASSSSAPDASAWPNGSSGDSRRVSSGTRSRRLPNATGPTASAR